MEQSLLSCLYRYQDIPFDDERNDECRLVCYCEYQHLSVDYFRRAGALQRLLGWYLEHTRKHQKIG